ncbi:MAG: thiol:disulfide interchange protein, partial [Gallionellales bacterium CG_4_10_14_3_um_filter_54_96]
MRFVLLLLLSLLAPVSHASSFLDKLPGLGGSQQATFLPPDQAFVLQVRARDADTLQADFTIAPGYYLYRDKISFTVAEGATKITAVKLPEGELKQDPNFGATVVYHQSFQAEIKLNRSSKEAVHLALNTSYQGCSDKGLCYPSQDKVLQL